MKTTIPILLLLFLVSCAQPSVKTEQAQGTGALTVKAEPMYEPAAPAVAPAPAGIPAAGSPRVAAVNPTPAPAPAPTQAPIAAPAAPAAAAPAQPTAPAQPAATPGAPEIQAALTPGADTNVAPETLFPAAEEIIPPGMIDFRNMPLEQALTVYSELVNRTLLRPASLPASQITLTTRTALTKREAVQALDSVFGLNGIAMINVGEKFVKAVAQQQAVQEGATPDTRTAEELPEFGPILTRVVQLKYSKPTEVAPVLTPFAKMNSILPIDTTQILVLRDYTENIKRMLEMIDKVDITVPGEFVSEVIPIKYAKASEIADALNSLSGGAGGSTSIGRSTGGATRSAVGNTGAGTMGTRSGVGGYNQGGLNQQGTMGGVAGAGAGAAAGSSFTERLRNIVSRAATATGDLEILGKTKMIADERSNSLLIFASRADMDMIKSVVEKLDVVLAQVLIETVIMDVNVGDTLAYGVAARQNPKTNSAGSAIGGIYNGNAALGALGDFLRQGQTNSPSQSGGLTYFGSYKGDIDVAITAAATDSRVNVIQKPRILTSHATPGSIFVGSTVPYVTSTYYGGGYSGPSSSYQQLQVGIGLTVTPFINPEGLVVMQIDETIDEVSGSVAITGVGDVPTTTSRKLSAEVAVNDGDTVILGGFIRNSSSKSASGVPILKDIPLIGGLFSARATSKARNELLVLMRPTVLKTPEIAAMATREEKSRMPGVRRAEVESIENEKAEMKDEEKWEKAQKKKEQEQMKKEEAQMKREALREKRNPAESDSTGVNSEPQFREVVE